MPFLICFVDTSIILSLRETVYTENSYYIVFSVNIPSKPRKFFLPILHSFYFWKVAFFFRFIVFFILNILFFLLGLFLNFLLLILTWMEGSYVLHLNLYLLLLNLFILLCMIVLHGVLELVLWICIVLRWVCVVFLFLDFDSLCCKQTIDCWLFGRSLCRHLNNYEISLD